MRNNLLESFGTFKKARSWNPLNAIKSHFQEKDHSSINDAGVGVVEVTREWDIYEYPLSEKIKSNIHTTQDQPKSFDTFSYLRC